MKTVNEKAIDYCLEVKGQIHQESIDDFEAGYKAAQEWISVDDELPPEHKFGMSEDVLTRAGSKLSVKKYDYIVKQWSGSQNITITHWRTIETN